MVENSYQYSNSQLPKLVILLFMREHFVAAHHDDHVER